MTYYKYIRSEENIADIFTKFIAESQFITLRNKLLSPQTLGGVFKNSVVTSQEHNGTTNKNNTKIT